jgi:hypothetical protein
VRVEWGREHGAEVAGPLERKAVASKRMRKTAMTEPPILDECRALLNELNSVERQISPLSGERGDSAAKQNNDEISQIEGLVYAQSEAGGAFEALRTRIVELGRRYSLCPQHVPAEGYSPSVLRGLLQSIQRIEQGFKQPTPSPQTCWPAWKLRPNSRRSCSLSFERARNGFPRRWSSSWTASSAR